MSQCLIKNSEYRTKLAQSGIPEDIFYSFANAFVAKHGRFPNLDEIPEADSTKHLQQTLKINKYDSASMKDILNVTQTSNIEEANIVLNDTYNDLEVHILPLNEEAIVNISRRPSEYWAEDKEPVEISENINQGVIFNQIFDKLRNLYGIEIISTTEKELQSWENMPDVKSVSAFVHQGKIYVNTDLANIDAPIHEMTHILLGSIRFKNPQLYQELVSMAEQFPGLESYKLNNPNKVYSDVLEELFVEETSKYLSGLGSQLNMLDNNVLYELHYNIKRLLDSALMGQYSVKSINDSQLYKMSLPKLAKLVNSQLLQINSLSSLDDSTLHRMLGNKKSELMEKGDLREEC